MLNGGKTLSEHTENGMLKKYHLTISEGDESCGYLNHNTEKFYCGGHCYYLDLKID